MKTNSIINSIIESIQDKKGQKICTIDLKDIPSAPASAFIICQGKTPSQTTAIADHVAEMTIKNSKIKPAHTDGMRNGQWIIMDYGDIFVHIFTPEFREFYNLEDLWADGDIQIIPELD